MKIVKLMVKNFRALQSIEVGFDKNLNVLIGKNDIGKSTILEAMEIFFNNSTVKLDTDDLCKFSNDKFIEIAVSFALDDFQLTIDTVPTAFNEEFLLDSQGFLTIIKKWDCSKSTITKTSLQVFLKANYPVAISNPLILQKSTALKKMVKDTFGDDIPDSVNLTTNSTMRLALYEDTDTTNLAEQEIPLDKEDAKKVWTNLEKDMPMFFLFQADRANKDSDKEVQEPLKAITKLAINEVQDELDNVIKKIETLVKEVGQNTIDKMQEMDPDLAESLKPDLSHKNWDSLFSFTFIGDNDIPINKRGSGFRRLLLLNYFRAEAERAGTNKPIIYAIEEPETALHPNWQKMLVNSLVELTENPNIQIFMTTHSPSLAGEVNRDCIRYINKTPENVIKIDEANNDNFEEICNTLGIFGDLNTLSDDELKVIVCVEGVHDVSFFYNVSHLFDIDVEHNKQILFVPLGGGTLMAWVDRKFLDKLPLPQIHIYDSDVNKYQKSIDKINDRNDGSFGTLTRMREIENYVHPILLKSLYQLKDDYFIDDEQWKEKWVSHDVVKYLSLYFIELNKKGHDIKGFKEGKIKKKLASTGTKMMTKELFEDLGAYEEVKSWFDTIKSKIDS